MTLDKVAQKADNLETMRQCQHRVVEAARQNDNQLEPLERKVSKLLSAQEDHAKRPRSCSRNFEMCSYHKFMREQESVHLRVVSQWETRMPNGRRGCWYGSKIASYSIWWTQVRTCAYFPAVEYEGGIPQRIINCLRERIEDSYLRRRHADTQFGVTPRVHLAFRDS